MSQTITEISSLRYKQELNEFPDLLRKISHLYNNQLQSILFHLQFAKDELAPEHSAYTDIDDADKIVKSTQSLANRIHNRLGQISLLNSTETINDIAERIISRANSIQSDQLEIKVSHQVADWKKVNCDINELAETIYLALENSSEALSQSGTIKVDLSMIDSSKISKEIPNLTGEYLKISVKDGGAGIPEVLHSKLFLPFTTSKNYNQGHGLALSRAARFAHLSGGFILIRTGNDGTEFSLFLPTLTSDNDTANQAGSAAAPQKNKETQELGQNGPKFQGLTFLVAEDNPIVLDVCLQILTREGANVIVASDGLKALELFLQNEKTIDMIITDIMMPELSGIEIAVSIHDQNPNCPILFMSGYYDSLEGYDRENLKDNQVVLKKPYLPKQLIDAITELLGS